MKKPIPQVVKLRLLIYLACFLSFIAGTTVDVLATLPHPALIAIFCGTAILAGTVVNKAARLTEPTLINTWMAVFALKDLVELENGMTYNPIERNKKMLRIKGLLPKMEEELSVVSGDRE